MQEQEIEEIKQILYAFEEALLVKKSLPGVINYLSDEIIGVGMGDQCVVRLKEDMARMLAFGLKPASPHQYFLQYGHVEIKQITPTVVSLCANITAIENHNEKMCKSNFFQTMTLVKQSKENKAGKESKEFEEWKICALHASPCGLTKENIENYPLKFIGPALNVIRKEIAEKPVGVLRKEMDEKTLKAIQKEFDKIDKTASQQKNSENSLSAEEQYRRAILADTIAFYLINFSRGVFEKSQVHSTYCAEVSEGEMYAEYINKKVQKQIAAEDIEGFLNTFSRKNIKRAFAEDKHELKYEYRLLRPDGTQKWVVTIARLIVDAVTGDHMGLVYINDIDGQKRKEIEMIRRSERDLLTGLYNRSVVVSRMEQHESENAPGGAFFIFDIDNFKNINDFYGHPYGDRVLKSIADSLKVLFRDSDVFARLGGDEFCVFLSGNCPHTRLLELAEKIKDELLLILLPDHRVGDLSCSIGIAICETSCAGFDCMYEKADKAMYYAKKHGKNRCAFFEEVVQASEEA